MVTFVDCFRVGGMARSRRLYISRVNKCGGLMLLGRSGILTNSRHSGELFTLANVGQERNGEEAEMAKLLLKRYYLNACECLLAFEIVQTQLARLSCDTASCNNTLVPTSRWPQVGCICAQKHSPALSIASQHTTLACRLRKCSSVSLQTQITGVGRR